MPRNAITIIKKYPNRRLYDTSTSMYITLSDVKDMVVRGEAMQVVDAKTEEDLTRHILMQILLEEEAGGAPIFNSEMLIGIIKTYGQAQQSVLGPWLGASIKNFLQAQQAFQSQMKGLPMMQMEMNPAKALQESIEKNTQFWQEFTEKQQEALGALFGKTQAGKNK